LLATNAALKISFKKKNTRRKDGGMAGWLTGWLAAGGGCARGMAEIGGGVIDYFHGCCSWCIYVTTIFLLNFFFKPKLG
jgi:hypothetical protein